MNQQRGPFPTKETAMSELLTNKNWIQKEINTQNQDICISQHFQAALFKRKKKLRDTPKAKKRTLMC